MDDALLAAYRASAYRVRLTGGGWATIRIDEALPDALAPYVGRHQWAFITAWNPGSQPVARSINRRSQRTLLEALHALAATVVVRPGCGVGTDGWHEPSFFVIGPGLGDMDILAHRYEQNAYVHGEGAQPARLRQLR
jgi:hypothetical protein